MPQRPALAVLAAFACAASLPTGARAGDDRILGLQLAAGAPDGAEATLLFRPLSFLRFEAGATTDLIAPGAHLGITLAVPWYLSPILNLEAGSLQPQAPADVTIVDPTRHVVRYTLINGEVRFTGEHA